MSWPPGAPVSVGLVGWEISDSQRLVWLNYLSTKLGKLRLWYWKSPGGRSRLVPTSTRVIPRETSGTQSYGSPWLTRTQRLPLRRESKNGC